MQDTRRLMARGGTASFAQPRNVFSQRASVHAASVDASVAEPPPGFCLCH